MIQRIQTLYLFIAAVLLIAVNFFGLVNFNVANGYYEMTSLGIKTFGAEEYAGSGWLCWLLPVISLCSAYFTLHALFGFKNRIHQMRRCVYAILTIIVYYVVFGFQVWQALNAIPDVTFTHGFMPSFYAQFPLIAIIFLILAGRAIKRDEDLVRSTERLR